MIERLVSILIYITGITGFVLVGSFMILVGIFAPRFFYPWMRPACNLILLSMWVRVDVIGQFPKSDRPFLIMFNHASFIELFILPYVIKGKFSAITASENFKIPVLGPLLRLLNMVPINRKNTAEAIANTKRAEAIFNKGFHVIVAPEGTRTVDGDLRAFKKGGFHMAVNTQASILPFIIEGAFQYKPKNRWIIHPTTLKVYLSDPIPTKGKTAADVQDLLEHTHNQFENVINKPANVVISA